MKYKIALGVDMGTVENRELDWDKITERLSRHSVAVTKGGRYLVGGQFADHRRQETSLVCRSMLTIDIDKLPEGVDIVDLESDLVLSVPYAFVAYSTFSHTPDTPRIRLIVPLSRDVSPGEYREVSRDFVGTLSEVVQEAIDKCSFVPNQFMYMPICPDMGSAWAYVQDGDAYPVPDQVLGDYAKAEKKRAKPSGVAPLLDLDAVEAVEAVVADTVVAEDEADIDDLADAVANEPLDLSDDEVDAYLRVYRAEGLEYDQWLMVGAALNHQYRRSETGYQRWLAWSKLSSKHDETQMRVKWRSFGKGTTFSLVTFKSVIFLAKEMGDVALREDRAAAREGEGGVASLPAKAMVELEAFEALAEAASEVDSVETYDAFKARLQRISLHILPVDKRSMLAQEVYDGWGKGKGLTKSDIKAAIQPPKAGKGALAEARDAAKRDLPEWLDGWVYIGVPAEFYNMRDHYALKREAFDAFFGREIEVVAAEVPASKLALNDYCIDTLVDLMFWPGAGITFDYEGKRMLNTYRETGIGPCVEMDADGQSVVDLFLRHVRFLLADDSEQRMLIDFMAWVVQNPGQKVNWSLVIQGAQGVGKSYFGHVMMMVLGDMARNVEPSSLAGRFTGWAHGATLVVIEEIRVTGENRYEIIDRLKPFISNATIQIEEKGRDHRTVPNFTSYLMFTNHKDALPLGAGDRRYAPVFSRVQSEAMLFEELGGEAEAGEYFNRLFSESQRRADALSLFLRQWKVSGEFNAKGRAPHTKARDLMMGLAVSPERRAVEDALVKHECAIIGDKLVDVTWLAMLCDIEGGEGLPRTRTLSAVMLDMGYEQIDGGRVWIGKNKRFHYVWQRGFGGDAKEAVKAYHDGD